jgi:RNA polymerase sigma-70 factor (ECF subfamily)
MEHAEQLRNFLYYKCGDLSRAEDLTQEAFVRLWDNCSKVKVGKAKSFLFTVANNLFLNEAKHQKVVLKFQRHQSSLPTASAESPQFLMEEKEFGQRLEQAISSLSEGQREVFLMNRIDKKTYKEIAETLGISVKAVEKRIHKALLQLRKLISGI